MRNEQVLRTEIIGCKETISILCILTGFFGTSVLGLYQFFTRLRFSLPTFSWLDYAIVVLGFIIGIVFVSILKGKKFLLLIIGFTSSTIISFLAFIILPTLVFIKDAIPLVHILNLELSPISIFIGLLSLTAILTTANVFRIIPRWNTLRMKCITHKTLSKFIGMPFILGISILLSVLLGLTCISITQNSHGTLIFITISGIIGLMGVYFNLNVRNQNSRGENMIQSSNELHTQARILEVVKNISSWLFTSIGFVILLYLIYVPLSNPREVVVFQLFYTSALIGTGVFLLTLSLETKRQLAKSRIYILKILGYISTIFVFYSINKGLYTHWFFRYFCFGIGLVCYIAIGIDLLAQTHCLVPSSIFFALVLGIAGYVSFIPAKIDSLVEGTSNLVLKIGFWGILGIELVINIISLLVYFRSKKRQKNLN